MREKIKLGDLLVKNGSLSPKDLKTALELQKEKKERLGKILVDLEFISEDKICEVLSQQMNLPKVDLTKSEFLFFDKRLEGVIKRRMVLPISKNNNLIVLAMADPLDVIAIDDVRRITGCEIKPVITTESQIRAAIKMYFSAFMAYELQQKNNPMLSKFVNEIQKTTPKPFSIDPSIFLKATKSVLGGKTVNLEAENMLGEVLVLNGVITKTQLEIAQTQRKGEKLGDILVRLKFTTRGRILTELTNILFKI